jgi:CubicO group peptidase (beta-lactamase class C family)
MTRGLLRNDLAASGTILPAARYPVFMSRRLLLVWFLAMATASANLQAQSIRRLDGTVLSATKATSIADAELKNDHVMGAQLAILNHGRLVWLHTYGLRDSEKNLPMTPDTNIWAASVTKGASHAAFALLGPRQLRFPRAG